MKLVVGIPWDSAFIWTKAIKAMLNMRHPPNVEVAFVFGSGWCPSRRHVDICEQALAASADAILICGADQCHPSDMLEKLMARYEQTGGQVITALVPFRGYVGWQAMKPFQPLAWRLECDGVREFRGASKDADMMKIIDPADGDFQRVNIIGSGVLLFSVAHLLSVRKPWFYDRGHPETMHRVADQDSKFVWRLQQEAGAEVWCDCTIQVRHLHDMEIDDSFQHRFDDWTEPGKGDPTMCRYRGAGLDSLRAGQPIESPVASSAAMAESV